MGAMFECVAQGRGQKTFPDDLKLMPSAFAADPPIGDKRRAQGLKGLSPPSQGGCQPRSFKPLLIIPVFLSYSIKNKKMAHSYTSGHRKNLISCPRDLITATGRLTPKVLNTLVPSIGYFRLHPQLYEWSSTGTWMIECKTPSLTSSRSQGPHGSPQGRG